MGSQPFALPWRQWGLRLTKAGDAIRWTPTGFAVDPPSGLYLPSGVLGSPVRMVWGWDGYGYVGGAPYIPKAIYDYLVAHAGPAPFGNPFHQADRNDYLVDLEPYATEEWQIGIFEEEARFLRVLLGETHASSGLKRVYVRRREHAWEQDSAEALHWRVCRMTLQANAGFGDFGIVTEGAPWLGLPYCTQQATWFPFPEWNPCLEVGPDGNPIIDAQTGAFVPIPESARKVVFDAVSPAISVPPAARPHGLGPCVNLWQRDAAETDWINRTVRTWALIRWDFSHVPGGPDENAKIVFSGEGTAGDVHVFISDQDAFHAPADAYDTGWKDIDMPFPTASEFGVDAQILEVTPELTWARFADFHKATHGGKEPEILGAMRVLLWAWQDMFADTSYYNPSFAGDATLEVHWANYKWAEPA